MGLCGKNLWKEEREGGRGNGEDPISVSHGCAAMGELKELSAVE